MGIKSLLLLSILFISLSPSQSAATKPMFNIFQYLATYPEYSGFVELLNRTRLAQDISTREQITVLVVRNENLGDVLPKQKLDVLQPMMCAHILMEFIDSFMLQGNRVKFPHEAVTVYQTTGVADGLQGRVKIHRTPGAYLIGSAIKGVQPTVKFVKTVRENKYTHSVMEVTGFIITPGISDEILPPPAAPLPAPAPKNATEKPSLEDAADAPADAPADDADAPADAPEEDAADSPADAPADDEKVADKDDGDKKAADDDDDSAPAPSSAGRLMFSLFGGAVIGSVLAAFSL